MANPIEIERVYPALLREIWDLWATAAGFRSWWGLVGFRADIRVFEPGPAGPLHYAMVADSAEMIAMMQAAGETGVTECRGHFSVFLPQEALELTQRIDFLPGVPAYDSRIGVRLRPVGQSTRMQVTLSPMHDEATSQMQKEGFLSQLTKLEERFG